MYIILTAKGLMTEDRITELANMCIPVFKKLGINPENVRFELGASVYWGFNKAKGVYGDNNEPRFYLSGLDSSLIISKLTLAEELEKVLPIKIEI